jgi:hypothetical protein
MIYYKLCTTVRNLVRNGVSRTAAARFYCIQVGAGLAASSLRDFAHSSDKVHISIYVLAAHPVVTVFRMPMPRLHPSPITTAQLPGVQKLVPLEKVSSHTHSVFEYLLPI